MVNLISIPEAVWEGELPFTPPLPDFSPGLAFAFGHGRTPEGPSVVAAIRYNMPEALTARYRGQVVPAIAMLAADVSTGEVYVQGCVGHDRPPAIFDPKAMSASKAPGTLFGGAVNMDLVNHLGLPPTAGRYLVCAWLDEWSSQARLLDLTAAAHRQRSPLQPEFKPAADNLVQAAATAPSGSPLRLTANGANKLLARWELADVSAVSLVGYDLAARSYKRLVLADGRSAHAKVGQAEVDVKATLGIGPLGVRAFLLMAGRHAVPLLLSAA